MEGQLLLKNKINICRFIQDQDQRQKLF